MRNFKNFITIFKIDFFEDIFGPGYACNILSLLESKYKAGFGVILWGQYPLTFMIPIYSTI